MVAGAQGKTWSGWAFVVAVLLFIVSAVGVSVRMRPVDITPAERGEPRFDGGSALATLRAILPGNDPHPVDSPASATMRHRIVEQLARIGYAADVEDTTSCRKVGMQTCARVRNIVVNVPGSDTSKAASAILLAAHYDSVAAGPGASDDGSGVAILIELARWLKQQGTHRRTVILLFTEGEEEGLLGAAAYARDHAIGTVLNMEARGTSGQSVMFETGSHSGWLVSTLARSADRPMTNSLINDIYRMMPNDTDMSVFKAQGVAGLNFAFGDNQGYYHTALDSLDHLDARSLQQQGDQVQGVLFQLLNAMPVDQASDHGEVYTDILSAVLLHWPVSAAPWLALAVFLALIGVVVFARKRRAVSLRGIAAGAALLPAAIGIGLAFAWLLQFAMVSLHGLRTPWHIAPIANRYLLWGVVALCVIGISRRAWARVNPLATWLGLCVAWSAVGLALAVAVPGGSYLFVLPGVVLACAAWVAVSVGHRYASRSWISLTLAASVAVFVVILPASFLIELMLGYNSLPGVLATSVMLALMFVWLVPLGLPAAGRASGRLLAATAAVALCAFVVTLRAPAFDAMHPRVNNIVYVQDGSGSGAVVIAGPSSMPLPDILRRAMGPELGARKALPWTSETFHAMPMRDAPLAAPGFELVSVEAESGGVVWNVRLTSAAGPRGFMLLLPPGAGLRAVEIDGRTLRYDDGASMLGKYQAFACRGDSCADKTLRLHLVGPGTEPWLLVSMHPGLPASAVAVGAARDHDAVAQNSGDQTLVIHSFRPDPAAVAGGRPALMGGASAPP